MPICWSGHATDKVNAMSEQIPLQEIDAIHDGTHCDPDCPFLKPWFHPYYHHSAWCWKQGRDLVWYDYWMADCVEHKPDENVTRHLTSGRTKFKPE